MRILMIPLDTFGVRSNEHMALRIRLLSRRNEIVGVTRDAPFAQDTVTLAALTRFLFYAFKVFLYGLRHRKDFDLIFCEESFHGLVGVCVSMLTGKPCIRDCVGVSPEFSQMEKRSKPFTFAELTSSRIVSRFAKMMLVLSEVDKRAYVEQGVAPDRIAVIPLNVDLTLADEAAAEKQLLRERLGLETNKRILIFAGRRQYPHNKKAAWWINDELAPRLSRRFDDVQILMTASGEVPRPTHPALMFTGFVPNVFEYIHASDIAIAPIELPTGVITIILDSMSCGKPTVVMASAANGIPQLADGHNAIVARDMGEFIEKTINVLEHLSEAQEIGTRARKTIEEHYDWNMWGARLNEVLQTCLT